MFLPGGGGNNGKGGLFHLPYSMFPERNFLALPLRVLPLTAIPADEKEKNGKMF